jgi:3-deoxy-D-manno-octulosonic-acid transferase
MARLDPLPCGLERVLALYGLVFRAALPLLRLNRRLAEGFLQRRWPVLPPADLWIHAASAGECLLAGQLLPRLALRGPTRVLLTTQTAEGLALARRLDSATDPQRLSVHSAYLPFDHPAQMTRAVAAVRPRLAILLETELWPGWLAALQRQRVPTLVLNGRLTARSLRRYRLARRLWPPLRPEAILAVSQRDAERFAHLFGRRGLAVMPNMKFDQIDPHGWRAAPEGALASLLAHLPRFLLLASTRRQEERQVEALLLVLRRRAPEAVVGLFPRHMERLPRWERRLDRLAIPWQRRSQARPPVAPGMTLLWDRFGELPQAYGLAHGAFVGGSLAPLGGQNFLEALRGGVAPVIGPHWENFAWVGRQLLESGLVHQARDWRQAADLLCEPPHAWTRDAVRRAARGYFLSRGGGSELAAALVARRLLRDGAPPRGARGLP